MTPLSEEFTLSSYVSMVWRRRVLVLLVALGMAGPAFAVSAVQTAQYQATAQVLLSQQALDANFNIQDVVLADTQVNNLVALMTGSDVAERARQQGATTTIAATTETTSNVITLSAVDPDPQRAVATVEAYVRAFSEYRTERARKTLNSAAAELQNRISGLQDQINEASLAGRGGLEQQQASLQAQLGRIEVQQGLTGSGVTLVQNPVVPQSPVSPMPVRDALFALVLGLALGITLAVLLETLRPRPVDEPVAAHQVPSPTPRRPPAQPDSPAHPEMTVPAPAVRGGATPPRQNGRAGLPTRYEAGRPQPDRR